MLRALEEQFGEIEVNFILSLESRPEYDSNESCVKLRILPVGWPIFFDYGSDVDVLNKARKPCEVRTLK